MTDSKDKIDGFEKLKCWMAARELVRLVYNASQQGELVKDFETRAQIKRAALSAMNNIAEGFGRSSDKEFIRFLDISQSSAMEVKSIGYVLSDMKYMPQESIEAIILKAEEAKGLTRGLMRHLRTKLT